MPDIKQNIDNFFIYRMLIYHITIKMSIIKDLFTEICKRGCVIETNSKYPIDHLPKSLVIINNNLIYDNGYTKSIAEFKMSSIIPKSIDVYFTKEDTEDYYLVVVWKKWGHGVYKFYESDEYQEKNMEQLDFLTHYLYTNGGKDPEIFYLNKGICKNHPSRDTLVSYRENLKTKMIITLIEENILKHIQILHDFYLPTELKLMIINMFMEINNWNNVGFFVGIFKEI